MNIQLLQWGLFCFMLGIILSLPLAAVYYSKAPYVRKLITNPRKLLSAHLDFLMQAFSLGFVYLLEFVQKSQLPMYIVVPIIFGAVGNPSVLLIEATPYHRSRVATILLKLLRATSPISLLLSWFVISVHFLPGYLQILMLGFALILGVILINLYYRGRQATWEG